MLLTCHSAAAIAAAALFRDIFWCSLVVVFFLLFNLNNHKNRY